MLTTKADSKEKIHFHLANVETATRRKKRFTSTKETKVFPIKVKMSHFCLAYRFTSKRQSWLPSLLFFSTCIFHASNNTNISRRRKQNRDYKTTQVADASVVAYNWISTYINDKKAACCFNICDTKSISLKIEQLGLEYDKKLKSVYAYAYMDHPPFFLQKEETTE